MLDMFASSGELRTQVAEIYARWKTAGAALETLERTEQEKLRLLDLWEFQRREIEGAAPAAAKTNRSMPSAASCRTSAACRRTPAPPTPRSTIRPKPRWRRCAWPPNGWTMCAASIHRSRSPARLSFGPGGESRPPGGDREPPGAARQAEAQIWQIHRRGAGVPGRSARADRTGGARR